MKPKTLEHKVENCLKTNALFQIKERPNDIVGICGYGIDLPCKYQTSYQNKKDKIGCIYQEPNKDEKFPDDYFGS